MKTWHVLAYVAAGYLVMRYLDAMGTFKVIPGMGRVATVA
jgi:hypothetical protein